MSHRITLEQVRAAMTAGTLTETMIRRSYRTKYGIQFDDSERRQHPLPIAMAFMISIDREGDLSAIIAMLTKQVAFDKAYLQPTRQR